MWTMPFNNPPRPGFDARRVFWISGWGSPPGLNPLHPTCTHQKAKFFPSGTFLWRLLSSSTPFPPKLPSVTFWVISFCLFDEIFGPHVSRADNCFFWLCHYFCQGWSPLTGGRLLLCRTLPPSHKNARKHEVLVCSLAYDPRLQLPWGINCLAPCDGNHTWGAALQIVVPPNPKRARRSHFGALFLCTLFVKKECWIPCKIVFM